LDFEINGLLSREILQETGKKQNIFAIFFFRCDLIYFYFYDDSVIIVQTNKGVFI
jgi:hypothetical protein